MTKVDRPKGLIRYDSFNGFAGKKRRYLRPRIYAYCALALLGLGMLTLVASKKARPFNVTISRNGGTGFYSDKDTVRNIYKIRVFNKHNQPAEITIHLGKDTPEGYELSGTEQTFTIPALSEISRTCVVMAPMKHYIGTSDISLDVHAQPGDVTIRKTTRFLGPNPRSSHENEDENDENHEKENHKD